MDIIQHGKKILNRITGKNDPDIRIGELDFPKISGEDITADNLSDIINDGSAIIGETSILLILTNGHSAIGKILFPHF